ncbi:cysteine-rich hydrophobic domain-containing protein 2-like, partial [Leptonychotes weddellii]|uniref:Cysteine-rich hydrophobic domain-containing protein 2-like n=1 Tax=Leptonychotes weddellii TaxID=9713 RepID=A0A7F8PZI3_LEPWE
MADFDEIYEEEEDEERALEEQLLKYSPDPVVVRGSGHVTVLPTISTNNSSSFSTSFYQWLWNSLSLLVFISGCQEIIHWGHLGGSV